MRRESSGAHEEGERRQPQILRSPPPSSHPNDEDLSLGTPEKTLGVPFAQNDISFFGVLWERGGGRGLSSTTMASKLMLTMFRIGEPAKPGQGLRVGATRRPPRGVPKSRWAADGYFDVWLPALGPSAKLLGEIRKYDFENPAQRKKFFDRYERELLANAESRQTVEFVAQVALRTPISIGCFCEDETRCHRLRLYKILQGHAAKG